MGAASLTQPEGWKCAEDALAEIRACEKDLQALVSSIFDQLNEMTNNLMAHELAQNELQQKTQHEALQKQIEQLSTVASQLTQAVAEQRELIQRGSLSS